MIFFHFSKKSGFGVFLVHPTMVLVRIGRIGRIGIGTHRSRDALSPVCGIFSLVFFDKMLFSAHAERVSVSPEFKKKIIW